MYARKLKTNDKIEVLVDGEETPYKSVIKKIGKKNIVIEKPVFQGRELNPKDNEVIKLKKYGNDGIHYFTCDYLGSKGNLQQLSLPVDYHRIQRRNFVRIYCALPLKYRPKNQDQYFKTETINMSGGGVRFYAKNVLETKQELDIVLELPEHTVECGARVVIPTPKNINEPEFIASVELLDIEEKDTSEIISFIFEKMRNRKM